MERFIPKEDSRIVQSVTGDIWSVASAAGLELIRTGLVNPASLGVENVRPLLNPDNILFTPLSHMGDLWEGTFYALVIAETAEVANSLQSKITHRKAPRWLTLTTGALLSLLAVTAAETSFFSHDTHQWDLADIPAGAAGAIGAPLVSYLIERKKFGNKKSVAKPIETTQG